MCTCETQARPCPTTKFLARSCASGEKPKSPAQPAKWCLVLMSCGAAQGESGSSEEEDDEDDDDSMDIVEWGVPRMAAKLRQGLGTGKSIFALAAEGK